MRSVVVVMVLAGWVGQARAEERGTVGSLGPVFTAFSVQVDEVERTRTAAGLRLTLSWEEPALAYPDQPGLRAGAGLVPELVVGMLAGDDRAEGEIGVGLRGELRLVQREQGWLKVSVRLVMYGAVRALVIGGDRDPVAEVVYGNYFLVGSRTRIGFEVGGMSRRGDEAAGHVGPTAFGQLYIGRAM
jgi:hypothetical protein